ncbi:hypothetical protein K438DRAFT_1188096 [Mycena galopus ATCC 62051]|nr:hypothetical protein K438DRAFT_1188096 [Mycena galopus ATCC 62051]
MLLSVRESPLFSRANYNWPRSSSIPHEREFARMAFWSSEKIAGHVRQCTVDLAGFRISVVSESDHPFVAACFEAVSKFKSLRNLSCSFYSLDGPEIEIPALRVDELSSLKSLHVNGARLVPSTSKSIGLRIGDCTYTQMPKYLPQEQMASSPSYLSFFDPSCLRRLYLETGSMADINYFLADKLAMAPFWHLRVLKLRLVAFRTTLAHVHAWISPFPAVDDLTLDIECGDGPVPSTPLASQLRAYKGSMPCIRGIDLRSTLLRTLTADRDGDAGSLLHILQMSGSTASTSITSLTIRVFFEDLMAGSVLRDTLLFFPNLRTLTMMVPCDRRSLRRHLSAEPFLRELVERLATVLTVVPALEEMVLDWRFRYKHWKKSWKDIIPSAEELEPMLLPALPSLRHISSI